MVFNYPNHPLFRITPLLNDGQNTVRHDEYTSRLIGRIRAGRYTPELWDCNSLILGYGERSGPIYRHQSAFKSRYEMTMQEVRDYQNSPEGQAERARLAEERKAKKERAIAEETALAARRREAAEERQRVGREIEARLEKQKAERAQQDREWAERSVQLAQAAEEKRQRTERARVLVAAELARRNAEYAEASARMEQRAAERALRRIAEERATLEPNEQLLAIFSRWLKPETTGQNP
jgi:hypothetical protein